jgi:hypothetical protein
MYQRISSQPSLPPIDRFITPLSPEAPFVTRESSAIDGVDSGQRSPCRRVAVVQPAPCAALSRALVALHQPPVASEVARGLGLVDKQALRTAIFAPGDGLYLFEEFDQQLLAELPEPLRPLCPNRWALASVGLSNRLLSRVLADLRLIAPRPGPLLPHDGPSRQRLQPELQGLMDLERSFVDGADARLCVLADAATLPDEDLAQMPPDTLKSLVRLLYLIPWGWTPLHGATFARLGPFEYVSQVSSAMAYRLKMSSAQETTSAWRLRLEHLQKHIDRFAEPWPNWPIARLVASQRIREAKRLLQAAMDAPAAPAVQLSF